MAISIKNKPNPYAEHLSSTAVNATTTTTKVTSKGAGVKEEKLMSSVDEQLSKGLVVATKELHKVEVGGGMTINLGNYESARIDVRLTVPCTKEELTEAYDWASDWVSERIQKAVKDAKGQN
jgi:hypothetical protein